jgi:asparaginyl-tRNA synthetase
MIEPEVAFADLKDKHGSSPKIFAVPHRYALENCVDDMEFLSKRYAEEEKLKPQAEREEMTLLEKLEFVRNNGFERITYTQAIDIP